MVNRNLLAADFEVAAAQIGGVHQSVASRIHLHYICVRRAGKCSLESSGGRGEVVRKGPSLRVKIAARVNLNHGHEIRIASAEVSGVNKTVPGRIQLRQE